MTMHFDFGQGVVFMTPGGTVSIVDNDGNEEEVGTLVSIEGSVGDMPIVNIPAEEMPATHHCDEHGHIYRLAANGA